MGRIGMKVVQGMDGIGMWFAKWGGLLFCALMTVSLFYACVFVALPTRPDYDPVFWMNFACFLVGQVWLNLFLFQYYTKFNNVSHWQRQSCVAELCRQAQSDSEPLLQRVDHSTGMIMSVDDEGNTVESGKYCLQCNREAPLRSHHCPLCDMCVLRKDHHCFVTGGCVGLGNQRFFMTFIFWAGIALAVFIRYYGEYALDQDPNLYPWGWTRLVGPLAILRWMLSYSTLGQAVSGTLISFAMAACLGCLGFFVMQIYYTLYGYTMYEYHSAMMRDAFDGDGETVGERLRLVFGRHWYLNFLFPVIWEMPVLTPQIANNLFHIRSKLL